MSGRVAITLDGQPTEVFRGTPIREFMGRSETLNGEPPLGAIAYGKLVGLDCRIGLPTDIRIVTMGSREGEAIYRRTVSVMLYAAVCDLLPEAKVVVGQSLAHGYYFDLEGAEPDDETVAAVERRMWDFVDRNEPLVGETIPVEEARVYFEQAGHREKVSLLQARRKSHVHTLRLGCFRDIQHGPVALGCGAIRHFALVRYPPGLVLQFDVRRGAATEPVPIQTKLFQIYRETRRWNEILGVAHVGDLNRLCIHGAVADVIKVAEGFHEKKVAAVADAIVERRPDVRLVTVAGPSSSGKTTFSKRLSIQLRVAGLRPVALSMDNWYRNRVETPIDPETGDYDFECIEALDLELFNTNLSDILAGKVVATPVYDFHDGVRIPEERWPRMRLEPDQVLIVEGIHGLNEQLTASVPAEAKFKVYVSALTQLGLDEHNRIFTSDSRLLRRIVRDARYRNYDAETTILRWPSVRAGERRWIFPFQEQADVMFNSALVYEVSVLKVFAEHYLLTVPPESPAYPETYRLLKFLEHFVPVPHDDVPRSSILREFIGKSNFRH